VTALHWLLAAGCRLTLDQGVDGVSLVVSRPGAALCGPDASAYTLRVRERTLEGALATALAWTRRAGEETEERTR